jgi:hypothetical protein
MGASLHRAVRWRAGHLQSNAARVAGLGRIYFMAIQNRWPRITRMGIEPKTLAGVLVGGSSQLIFAFVSPILRLNGTALHNSFFAAQLDRRKNWICSSFSEDLTSHSQLVRE